MSEGKVFYSNSGEHLLDECKRMELWLQISMNKLIKKDGLSNSFPGLFIGEREISSLINESGEKIDGEPILDMEKLKDRFLKLTEEIAEKKNNSVKMNIFLSLIFLQNIFKLSPFEIDVVILCLLPELHNKFERIYGYLNDDITLKNPTIGLVSDLLSSSEESRIVIFRYFLQENDLFRYVILKQVDSGENRGISSKTLKIDERILTYLFEINDLDPSIASSCTLKIPGAEITECRLAPDIKKNISRVLKDHLETKTSRVKLFINLNGSCGSGRKFTAESLCKEAGIFLLRVDIEDIVKIDMSFKVLLKKVFREGILQPAAIYFENIEVLFRDDEKERAFRRLFFEVSNELSWITFFSGEYNKLSREEALNKHVFINIDFPIPNSMNRKRIWKDLLEKEGIDIPEAALDSLANKFRFTEGQILNAISSARNIVRCNNGSGKKTLLESVYEGCRLQSNHRLSTHAKKVNSKYTWDDIVLPKDRLEQLREISSYIRYKDVVYEEWGFNKKLTLGRGLNILFSGPSGTGKTMASEVIANDLGLELYKIELSSVVSKYIGETEKNLAKIFMEAETSNAILFFDEADALFGKRSEVRDAHDRYANIEICYLLQKMEEYDGVVILASNLNKNIDDAFLRRMHFIVEFPFPDEDSRERIWRNIFPAKVPLDNGLDYDFLAYKFKFAGGNIKNAALHAAFQSAENSRGISMEHIMQGIRREYQKMGYFLSPDIIAHNRSEE